LNHINANTFEGRLLRTLKNHTYAIWTTVLLPNGNLVTGSWDNSIGIWEVSTGILLKKLIGHGSYVTALALLSNDRLASSTKSNELFIWSLKKNGSILYKLPTSLYTIMKLIVLPINGYLVAGAYPNYAEVWNPNNGSLVFNLGSTNIKSFSDKSHSFPWVLRGGFKSFVILDNERLAIGSYNIDIWNPYNATLLFTLDHSKEIWSMALLSNNRLAVGANDGQISIWNIKSNNKTLLYNLTSHADCANVLTVISDDLLASGSYDDTIKIWNLKNGTLLHTLQSHKNMLSSLSMFTNGLMASGSHDCTAKIWNPKTGILIKTLENHTSYIYDVRSLPNGLLATASKDGTVKIWK